MTMGIMMNDSHRYVDSQSDVYGFLQALGRNSESSETITRWRASVADASCVDAPRTILELRRLGSSVRAPLEHDHGYYDERFPPLRGLAE